MVTLSASFKLINEFPAAVAPEIVLAPVGFMVNVAQVPAFKTAVSVLSSVSLLIVITMALPVCEAPLMAAKALRKVV